MTNLDSIFKNRDINLMTKVRLVKAIVFPVVMYRCERIKTVTNFVFWGSKFTADGDCSHEIKRHLLLGRKVMTILDNILKSRDIILATIVCAALVFPVVIYGCESWTIKKKIWTIKLSTEELMLLNCGVGEDS